MIGEVDFMGRFDGLLLCTDLDDTLLTTDKRISHGNRRAIEHFKAEGGLFAFTTGRCIAGAKLLLNHIKPNVPMICFNGAGIYDFENDKMLYLNKLNDNAKRAVEFIYNKFPYAAIDVCTARESVFCRTSKRLEMHKKYENLPDNYGDYRDISDDWVKVIFMVEEEQVDTIRQAFAESEFAEEFEFMQSSPWYYELLPKGSNKGTGLLELAKLLNIPVEKTIGIGDNYNDIPLITRAGAGVAVANAVKPALEAADYITVDNNSDALKAVIEAIEKGIISI